MTDAAILRRLVAPAYLPTFFWGITAGATMPVVALSGRALGATVEVAALLVGLGTIAEFVIAVPVGKVVDRFGERRTLLLSGGLMIVAMILGATAPSVAWLALAIVLQSPAVVAFIVARQGFIADSVPLHFRARALSTLGGVARAGILVGPFLAAPTIAAWGPQAGFGVGAAAAIVTAVVVALAVHDPVHAAGAEDGGRPAPVRTRDVLRSQRLVFLTIGIGVLAIGLARSAYVVVTPLWAEHIGVSAAQTAVLFGVVAAVEVSLFFAAGWLSDRYGRAASAVPCAMLIGIGLVLLPSTATFAALMAVALIVGVGNGLGSGIVMTLGVDSAPAQGRGAFLSLWRMFSLVGHNGASIVVAGVTALASLAASAVTVGGLAVLGGFWMLRWLPAHDRRRRGRDRRPTA